MELIKYKEGVWIEKEYCQNYINEHSEPGENDCLIWQGYFDIWYLSR